MKHIKHLVSDKFADTLMEQFGYETKPVVEEAKKDEVVVEEEVSTQHFYKHDGKLYELHENVEEFDGELFIEVSELTEDVMVSLEEGSYTLLESVQLDNDEFNLSEDLFQDEEGSRFVQLIQK